MGYCEVCGKYGYLRRVMIDGAYLYACNRCIKNSKRKIIRFKIRYIREDYNKIVRMARLELGISIDELADRLNVTPLLIDLLEAKKCKPDETLAKRLEEVLNIRLFEEEVYA